MTNTELAMAIRHKLFADRSNLNDAMAYAFEVFRRLGPDGEMAATTAFMVVMNTLANELEKVESNKA